MARPPLTVRLIQGSMLPVPPDDSRDGTIVLTPEATMLVRDSSWARRRIARGDLEIVQSLELIDLDMEPLETAEALPGVSMPPLSGVLIDPGEFEGRTFKAEAIEPIADDKTIDPED